MAIRAGDRVMCMSRPWPERGLHLREIYIVERVRDDGFLILESLSYGWNPRRFQKLKPLAPVTEEEMDALI